MGRSILDIDVPHGGRTNCLVSPLRLSSLKQGPHWDLRASAPILHVGVWRGSASHNERKERIYCQRVSLQASHVYEHPCSGRLMKRSVASRCLSEGSSHNTTPDEGCETEPHQGPQHNA
ncbi:hypothetical protein ACOMHN_048219 [Nucella lapillus]